MAGRSPIWHPFTQHGLEPPFKRIIGTAGAELIDQDGRAVFDAISSWWVITHGHRHPVIQAAIQAAAEQFDQIIFAEYSHQPAEDLAAALVALAPPGLAHVFFSDSGSTAVEVAIKMALGFYHNQGRPRHRLAVLEHGYHGDTVGTMSAGARGVFNAPYARLLFAVETIPFPAPGREQASLDHLEALCRTGELAALLVEPLVLGAGGMRLYSPAVLAEFRRITAQYDTLLIADEVMTGWGRTGSLFAVEQAGISPDLLCLSKGLTGGALPLAATLSTPAIFAAHHSTDRARMFFHSSSFTANPIACAAALANVQLWRDEPVRARITRLVEAQAARLTPFRQDRRFADVRQIGTITALDLRGATGGYLSDLGPRLRAFFRQQDLLIRPLGPVIYLLPPYCTSDDQLDRAYAAIDQAASLFGALG